MKPLRRGGSGGGLGREGLQREETGPPRDPATRAGPPLKSGHGAGDPWGWQGGTSPLPLPGRTGVVFLRLLPNSPPSLVQVRRWDSIAELWWVRGPGVCHREGQPLFSGPRSSCLGRGSAQRHGGERTHMHTQAQAGACTHSRKGEHPDPRACPTSSKPPLHTVAALSVQHQHPPPGVVPQRTRQGRVGKGGTGAAHPPGDR